MEYRSYKIYFKRIEKMLKRIDVKKNIHLSKILIPKSFDLSNKINLLS